MLVVNQRLKAEKILKELDYEFQGFSIDHFIRCVGDFTGRQILSTPWQMPSGLFGAWLSDDDVPHEYIFYRHDVPLIHQIHIQLHEVAHLLFGHPTLHVNRERITASLSGQETLPFAEYVLLRSATQSDIEAEAETLASMIQEQVIRHSHLDQLTRDLSSDDKLARFVNNMGLV
jgi:hypothetical protein